MNVLRESLLTKLGSHCGRCKFNQDSRILKLRSPVSRKGKGDSTYWSECIQLFENDQSGFEVVCPNCLEIEKVNKHTKPKIHEVDFPTKIIFSPVGFGMEHPWADKLIKEGELVYMLDPQTNLVHQYKDWTRPVASVEYLADYFNISVSMLTDSDECVTLERV